MHSPWFITAAILVGGYSAFIGYLFFVVSEISESGWWIVFSTLLPYSIYSAAGIGGMAFPMVGLPLALVAFFLRKRWWQVGGILAVTLAGALLPASPLFLWAALALFAAVHLVFTILRGRDSLRTLGAGLVLMIAGCTCLGYGLSLQ